MRKTFIMIAAMGIVAGCGRQTMQDASLSDSIQTMEHEADAMNTPILSSLDSLVYAGAVQTMGKVVAARFADLSFETALPIEEVLVRNGLQVRRGQVLARLDQFKLRNAIEQQQRIIEQAQLQIEQAHLQMQDVIISQGYDPDKDAEIPEDVSHTADVKSGYALAKSQLATASIGLAAAQHELRSSVLTAPFDGVVANLTVQAHQLTQPGQTVCRLIDTNNMEVEFRIMESDLNKYRIGTKVSIIPIADKSSSYEASVHVINPVVDEQGAVTLRAKLTESLGLFDGMNVEVILRLTMDN